MVLVPSLALSVIVAPASPVPLTVVLSLLPMLMGVVTESMDTGGVTVSENDWAS